MMAMTKSHEPILVIDTSYGLSIGVVGQEPLHEADSRQHVEKIEPFIARAVENAGFTPKDVKTVVVGTGPAPFTGLRAGIVSAKAFAFATGAEILGQDVLEPQAWWEMERSPLGEGEHRLVLAVNDARRKQLYFQLFDVSADGVTSLTEMDIQYPPTIVEKVMHTVEAASGANAGSDAGDDSLTLSVVGHGAQKYSEAWKAFSDSGIAVGDVIDESVLHADGSRGLEIFAQTALAKADRGEKLPADPLYLRRPDVSLPPPLKPVLKAER